MKDPKFVSVVVRLYNAETRIAHFLRSLDDYFAERFSAYEFVVVNDGSKDSSARIVKDLAPSLHGSLAMVKMANHHGRERAMVAGLDRAMGDFVFEFEDTYLDYPLDVIARMYETAIGGFDVVAAVPDRVPRRVRLFFRVCNRFSNLDPPLAPERLRVASRRAVDAMLQQRERIRYRQVLYRFTGYRHAQVGYQPVGGRTPRAQDDFRFALDVVFSFTNAGVRVAHVLVLAFAVLSVVALVLVIVLAILRDFPAWELAIIIITAVGFCGVFLLLAILGEYAARILAEVRSRPMYTLDPTQTWTITPTETRRVPMPVPDSERVLARGDAEPFMLQQRRQAEGDLRRAESGAGPAAG